MPPPSLCCPRSSKRISLWLIGAAVVVTASSLVVAKSETPASAAACSGCFVVSAPTIDLNVTAQPGQQAVIDQQGGVAVYTPLTTGTIGGAGTIWVVGHRTTHGSVFNRVPSLVPGDPITLIDDAGAQQYIVNRLLIVSESDWESQIDIHDSSRSLLILQTSHPDKHLRYLIEAFGTGPAPTPVVVGDAVVPAATTTSPPTPTSVLSPAIDPPRRSKFGSIKSVV